MVHNSASVLKSWARTWCQPDDDLVRFHAIDEAARRSEMACDELRDIALGAMRPGDFLGDSGTEEVKDPATSRVDELLREYNAMFPALSITLPSGTEITFRVESNSKQLEDSREDLYKLPKSEQERYRNSRYEQAPLVIGATLEGFPSFCGGKILHNFWASLFIKTKSKYTFGGMRYDGYPASYHKNDRAALYKAMIRHLTARYYAGGGYNPPPIIFTDRKQSASKDSTMSLWDMAVLLNAESTGEYRNPNSGNTVNVFILHPEQYQ